MFAVNLTFFTNIICYMMLGNASQNHIILYSYCGKSALMQLISLFLVLSVASSIILYWE